jgi:hypothetical protein
VEGARRQYHSENADAHRKFITRCRFQVNLGVRADHVPPADAAEEGLLGREEWAHGAGYAVAADNEVERRPVAADTVFSC